MASVATANVLKWLPPAVWNTEIQTLLLTMLCFVGAWVVVTKLIQILFSILWPLIVLGGIFIMAPNVSMEWLIQNVPVYATNFTEWLKKSFGDISAPKTK